MALARALAALGVLSVFGGAAALLFGVDPRATSLGPGHLALALLPIAGIALLLLSGFLRREGP
jgi:hypothetical protein